MSTEENKALVRHILQEMNSGNLAIMNDHPGLREALPHIKLMAEARPDTKAEIAQQLTDGDWVVTRLLLSGVLAKEFMGTPAGTPYASETILLYKVVNGKVVEMHSQAGRVG